MNTESVLAKKYATAFLNVAGDRFDTHELERVDKLQKFLAHAHEVLFFFNLPLVEQGVAQKVLDILCKGFTTESLLKRLMNLVCSERRAFLIPDVLYHIASLYRERNNLVLFTVESAQELSEDDKKMLKSFLEEQTKKIVNADYTVDQTLIAGVRALSGTLLWEHSVRQQLMVLQQSLIEQGI